MNSFSLSHLCSKNNFSRKLQHISKLVIINKPTVLIKRNLFNQYNPLYSSNLIVAKLLEEKKSDPFSLNNQLDPNNDFCYKIPALSADIIRKYGEGTGPFITCQYFKIQAIPWPIGESIFEKKSGQELKDFRVSYLCSKALTSKLKVTRSKIIFRARLAGIITFPNFATKRCDYIIQLNLSALSAPWPKLLDELENSLFLLSDKLKAIEAIHLSSP